MQDPIIFYVHASVWMVLLTLGIFVGTALTAAIYAGIHRTTRRIERAYVSLSHHGPGIEFGFARSSSWDPIQKQDVRVNFKIRNHGNTPATVTRILVQAFVAVPPLPAKPVYDESLGERIDASLVKGTQINYPKVFCIPSDDIHRVRSFQNIVAECERPWRLYVTGYVDYIDRFQTRHRAGYARMYNEWIEFKGVQPDDPVMRTQSELEERHRRRNNLVFEAPAGYNYDRERKEGEGNDWDES